jgi:hypothetical protein
VLLSTTATQGNSDVQAVLRDQLHRFASQRVDLSLTTQSGRASSSISLPTPTASPSISSWPRVRWTMTIALP